MTGKEKREKMAWVLAQIEEDIKKMKAIDNSRLTLYDLYIRGLATVLSNQKP